MVWSIPRPDSTQTTIRSSALGSPCSMACCRRRVRQSRNILHGRHVARHAAAANCDQQIAGRRARVKAERRGSRPQYRNRDQRARPERRAPRPGCASPARISRRFSAAGLVGDAGTAEPIRLTRSLPDRAGRAEQLDRLRRGATGAAVHAFGPRRADPAAAVTPATSRKTPAVSASNMPTPRWSRFSDDQVAQQLQAQSRRKQFMSGRIGRRRSARTAGSPRTSAPPQPTESPTESVPTSDPARSPRGCARAV